MNANLYALFESRFPQDRSACSIETHDGLLYSWNDLERATAKMANLLASLALPPDSRIAVQVEKSPEALMLYLATIRAGYVYLPLNTAYRAAEIEYFIGDAEPAVVVCSPENFGWVSQLAFKAGTRHVFTLGEDRQGSLLSRAAGQPDTFATVERKPDDLAAILYTSGTTGRSKGAMLSHDNLASNVKVLQEAWAWQKGDVLLHALPLFHVHGLFVASNGALYNGSKMIFLPKFDGAEVMRQLPRATVFMGVPTYYVRLLADPAFGREACAGIRLFVSGSAPLLLETFTEFARRTGHTILERYGMSETTMLVSNPYEGERIGGTVGHPLPGVSVRVVRDDGSACGVDEIGGIEVKGPNVFHGYWRMPEKTKEEFTADGFFKTGDVGRFDAKGYLTIVGRSKDLIISGGYNVYPKEIESIIDEMEGVAESAVIGVPHPDFGEAVTAVVVLKKEARLTAQDIIGPLKSRIANFKVPKQVHFVAELPRNTMGKVQKNVLRQQYSPA
ncbi:malonyl-CoA/methylmalonyl-CoA synthetase [Noviherbaspirillum humi]|uniref:Malonyl-CoA/methylmalonyl-CoA synthetase n=1 Tax=Noviherbaspirillum humi TaxID=1688639 RepID=A0A239IYF9_9BURK|nr:malonyl-CoA synthase [Noviherbaspirillum humi]SNS98565.1 malonyl-CoA/methylmalonyl-CoA synthetase [Noviherbaspirillum humi]